MTKYMHGERQRALIIRTGIELWHEGGESAVTARGIGKRVGLSHAGVLFHFGGISALKDAVKREAIASGDTRVIPALIVAADPLVADWTQEQKQGWLRVAG